jgi:hypothetical protein
MVSSDRRATILAGPGEIVVIEEADYCYDVRVLRLRLTSLGDGKAVHARAEWVQVEGMEPTSTGRERGTRSALVRVSTLRREPLEEPKSGAPMEVGVTHTLERLSWRCSCGEPWPCAVRREQFLDEYSGNLTELRVMLAGFLPKADGTGVDTAALRRQLLGWLPPREVRPYGTS